MFRIDGRDTTFGPRNGRPLGGGTCDDCVGGMLALRNCGAALGGGGTSGVWDRGLSEP